MTKFTVQVGRDARVYFSAEIEAESLEAAKNMVSRHGFNAAQGTSWIDDGTDVFDNVETCNISEPDGNVLADWNEGDGWKEEL